MCIFVNVYYPLIPLNTVTVQHVSIIMYSVNCHSLPALPVVVSGSFTVPMKSIIHYEAAFSTDINHEMQNLSVKG